MYELTTVIEQLNAEGKEVIAISSSIVLCHWHEDNSFVTWRWYISQDNKAYVEAGNYFRDLSSALTGFKERI